MPAAGVGKHPQPGLKAHQDSSSENAGGYTILPATWPLRHSANNIKSKGLREYRNEREKKKQIKYEEWKKKIQNFAAREI